MIQQLSQFIYLGFLNDKFQSHIINYKPHNKMGNTEGLCTEIKLQPKQISPYGHIYIIQKQKKLIKIQKRIEKKQSLKNKVDMYLSNKLKLKSPFVVQLKDYDVVQQQYFYNIQLTYAYVTTTLNARLQAAQFDSLESELNKMINDVQKALLYLYKHKINHSNITKQTILFQDNTYKVCDNVFITHETSYLRALKFDSVELLSNRLLVLLKHRAQDIKYSLKDDLFSLGLQVLSIITGSSQQSYYDWKNKQIMTQEIYRGIQKCKILFSSKFLNRIKYLILSTETSVKSQLMYELDQLDVSYKSIICKCQQQSQSSL